MGITDKIAHAANELTGRAKEAVGRLTDNEDLVDKGRAEQARADLDQAGDRLSDAGSDVAGAARDVKEDVASAADAVTDEVAGAARDAKDSVGR